MNLIYLNKINDFFTKELGPNLFDKTADLITGITPLFGLGFSIYILTLLFFYYKRGLDDAAVDIFKGMTGWLLVIALAFNADNYAWLAKEVYTLPETLSGWLSGKTINPSLFSSYLSNYEKMDAAFSDFTKSLDWYNVADRLLAAFASLINFAVGVIILIVAWFFYLLAKLDLALVLMVGPLFVGAMLFPSTRQYGMNWIGQILNYSIIIGLYTVLFLILLAFFESILDGMVKEAMKTTSIKVIWDSTVMTVSLGILMLLAVLKIPSIAAALTGGAQFTSGVGQAVGAAMSVKSMGMSRALNRMMSNRIGKG